MLLFLFSNKQNKIKPEVSPYVCYFLYVYLKKIKRKNVAFTFKVRNINIINLLQIYICMYKAGRCY